LDPSLDITPFDLQRMIFGDHPLLFSVEVVLRTVVVYAYALLLLRWLGSRTIGQLSMVELLLVIALGSAVGDAMFYPDVPLLHSLIVVTVVVVANKGLDLMIARSRRAEHAIDGRARELIADGVMTLGFLRSTTLGVGELFQQLRHSGIEQLGEVRHAYVEPSGEITVFRRRDPKPGLPIVPPWEVRHPPVVGAAEQASGGILACLRCGTLRDPGAATQRCTHCGHHKWTLAVEPQPGSGG
jgi:uncharacterized membrane protein YcaP (DUF421 family)